MARDPKIRISEKPWRHAASGWWCATIDGRRKKLDKDFVAASRKLKALRVQAKKGFVGNRDWWDAPFSELADGYLDFIKAKKKPSTYDIFRYAILRSLKIIGTGVRVCQLRKYHLERVDTKLQADGYSPTTIKNTITTVRGVLGWAVEAERIDVHTRSLVRCNSTVIGLSFMSHYPIVSNNLRRLTPGALPRIWTKIRCFAA